MLGDKEDISNRLGTSKTQIDPQDPSFVFDDFFLTRTLPFKRKTKFKDQKRYWKRLKQIAMSEIEESNAIPKYSTIEAGPSVYPAKKYCDLTGGLAKTRETANGGLTCQVCGIGFGSQAEFESVESQRDHFKSDWHRYNLQRSQSHRPAIDWDQFQLKIENNDVSSISGSESDSDQEEGHPSGSNLSEKSDQSMVVFVTKDGLCFRIWRCLLESSIEHKMEQELESAFHELTELKSWSVILAKGGHFAAACFERLELKKQSKPGDQMFKIKVHKTLHRYVVRAKAGGRQSTKDASGKYAKSAGATLRRYNEAALERDIHEILTSWKQELDSCRLIFLSVSNSDKKAVFGGDKPCLNSHDPRIRNVPFVTRRPTFSEAKRVSSVLMATFNYSQIVSESKEPEELTETEPKSQSSSVIKESTVEAKPEAELVSLEEREGMANKINKKKKKNRKRSKTKDQRRNQAMDTADKLSEQGPESEADDEDVDQAILEATKEFEKMNSRRKEKTKPQKKEESIEERRKKLREAAEQRMALLKNASKSQGLW
eukprot:g2412.t1